jgi:hypothetical protein
LSLKDCFIESTFIAMQMPHAHASRFAPHVPAVTGSRWSSA